MQFSVKLLGSIPRKKVGGGEREGKEEVAGHGDPNPVLWKAESRGSQV